MKVLVACEESGRVRDAFVARGHDAMSCDLLPTSTPGNHYRGDVFDIIDDGFDLMIAHPVCTFLCLSSARWFWHPEDKDLCESEKRPHPDYPDRMNDFQDGIDFFLKLQNADIPKICIENSTPLGRTIHHAGRPAQIVQPWWFGDPLTKGAALWLKGLRPLSATHDKPENIKAEAHELPPSKDRARLRSQTNLAIANAMAEQWGMENYNPNQIGLFA